MNMNLRLPEDVHARIKEAAEEDGTSVNSEVVLAVREYLARRQTERVRRYALDIAQEDAELLARLAE
ncbi:MULTISPECIES: Arc family DNA-binding protein [Nocardiopsidaceae]|uniref:Arc family DNA-binding protein n=2 Tax=Nocardiopsidaceae TaxID=83676 RepID=A0ABY6YQN4_9ACTN|nr:Arc family DNA-binding protein [Streptomonospora nanhaiensis]WAE74391.1 Arc family DNA-binding protein [Streptomonospora nanhaiensis]